MDEKYIFFIVDEDPFFTEELSDVLTSDGQTVYSGTVSTDIVPEIITKKPDCIILNIITPGAESLKLLQHLRQGSALRDTRIAIMSAQPDELDRQLVFASGADSLITKPIDKRTIADDLKRIIEEKFTFTFWGVRGTLTVPGRKTLRYGGNTPCVSFRVPGDTLLIFDGGSGIKELSNLLLSDARILTRATIFISHPHWDHINGLPFFVPLYPRGNTLEICGPPNNGMSMRELIA
ncbi:MAG: response regulator, partial [Syntrophales bacterium]|nr:response regulator [Syntrophales bacterium]